GPSTSLLQRVHCDRVGCMNHPSTRWSRVRGMGSFTCLEDLPFSGSRFSLGDTSSKPAVRLVHLHQHSPRALQLEKSLRQQPPSCPSLLSGNCSTRQRRDRANRSTLVGRVCHDGGRSAPSSCRPARHFAARAV